MPNFAINEPNIVLQSPFIMILNGMLAFLSPCILPMLPVYASYLIGTSGTSKIDKTILKRIFGLMLGFVLVFVLLGAFGGLAGSFTKSSKNLRMIIDIVSSVLIIVFGLMMLGYIPVLNIFTYKGDASKLIGNGFLQNAIFGAVLVLSWAPCLTPTLGIALTAVASVESANVLKGIYILFFYAIGLVIPFIAIILLYNKLNNLILFLKKNNNTIRKIAGVVMTIYGIYKLIDLII